MTHSGPLLFLGGDVMTGRGVDQILPHPGDPRLHEDYVRDARTYVGLAEIVNGPIPCPVDFSWPWGDALAVLDEVAPEVRVLNLETSVTRSDDVDRRKSVHYRMTPANVGCLTAARPDACVLANNHVLDFGRGGLEETLDSLAAAGIAAVGAGRDASAAAAPVIVPVEHGRVVVFSFATQSSGVPRDWVANENHAGVDLLPSLSGTVAGEVVERVRRVRRPGDVVVASIHWGANWGYEVPAEHVDFAHRIVDGGVDVVHGHSSHHPLPIEVYRDKLILYGCGDLVDDYEGISGYEAYRDDLRLLYFVSVEPDTGSLRRLRMVALRAGRMRLNHATDEDTEHLRGVLSQGFGSRVERAAGGTLDLSPARS